MIPKGLLIFLTATTLYGSGVVVVVQPILTEQDYRSVGHFRGALEPYFEEISQCVAEAEHRLVILPEYIGTWLVAVDERRGVFKAKNINCAMTRLILSHPVLFLARFTGGFFQPFKARVMGRVQRSIFLMQSCKVRDAYQRVFAELARSYGCWIVAGSILLPDARIKDGSIILMDDRKTLLNQSFVFNPAGDVVLVSKKVYPISDELLFLDRGEREYLAVLETDLGRLGVLVCADSWYPDCYAALDSQGVEIVAVPSFASPGDIWEQPWRGYNPPDFEPEDIDPVDKTGVYLESEMWDKYALLGRLSATGATAGGNSFLLGSFWGLTGCGLSKLVHHGEVTAEAWHHLEKDILYFTLTR